MVLNIHGIISMVFTKLFLENALGIRPCNCDAASEPLLPKVARCIPVLPSRHVGKCAARVLKGSDQPWQSAVVSWLSTERSLESCEYTVLLFQEIFYFKVSGFTNSFNLRACSHDPGTTHCPGATH